MLPLGRALGLVCFKPSQRRTEAAREHEPVGKAHLLEKIVDRTRRHQRFVGRGDEPFVRFQLVASNRVRSAQQAQIARRIFEEIQRHKLERRPKPAHIGLRIPDDFVHGIFFADAVEHCLHKARKPAHAVLFARVRPRHVVVEILQNLGVRVGGFLARRAVRYNLPRQARDALAAFRPHGNHGVVGGFELFPNSRGFRNIADFERVYRRAQRLRTQPQKRVVAAASLEQNSFVCDFGFHLKQPPVAFAGNRDNVRFLRFRARVEAKSRAPKAVAVPERFGALGVETHSPRARDFFFY